MFHWIRLGIGFVGVDSVNKVSVGVCLTRVVFVTASQLSESGFSG